MQEILYYNIDDTLDYENKLLKEWRISDLRLVEIKDKSGKKAMVDYARNAAGLVVEYEQVTGEKLQKLPNLKIVSLQSIGYNNVDTAAATELGVCVTNTPGFCAEEVATHAVGLMMDLARKITYFDRTVRQGKWDPLLGYPLHRMSGKTVGLVYFGNIPKRMVPILHALQMRILVFAPTKSKEYLAEFGCEKAEMLEELLERSDFVSLHTPLMPSTTHLIGEGELKKMKKTAFLINTARGAVVDEAALVKALRSGEILGAGIDVIEDEETEKSELFNLENTVITPHAAFISEDSFYDARKKALEQLVQRLSKGERPDFLVNKDVQF
ncbi:MAG: C-terminal binding protein [Oscillospiraceae bacterium]|jgi:D-3-phosphoglycerate dehydrogenase|nr:C-terminal binding protein [Oscillospiraceae bacterium]MCI1990580.1 C-terminal binding protein [Oscillospiraceae bacterium]MCI2036280.1 C-terminal binding protein [Oscillospiraceae bacterium]